MRKIRIAVVFGGPSPEHDVSIVTGLQALEALDPAKYEAFPVYITGKGEWRVGAILRDAKAYMLEPMAMSKTRRVVPDLGPCLRPYPAPFIGQGRTLPFDVALLAFHGGVGEAGGIQGLCEALSIPYTGMSTLGCAVAMHKTTAKKLFASLGIPVLPDRIIPRPQSGGYYVAIKDLEEMLGVLPFPLCLKPLNLGSSIGAAKVNTLEEIQACLPSIFALDTAAMVEPFIENLVEYNVAVAHWGLSAIERPKTKAELLSFKEKYCTQEDGKLGGAKAQPISAGMLSMTRDINPNLPLSMTRNIQDWATRAFVALGERGAPRIDFYADAKTGQIWINEINPIPGSFAYFLWEVAKKPLMFTEVLDALIEESRAIHAATRLPPDPVPIDARLFPR